MKKLLLIGAFALTSLFVSAQDGLRGTWFVGGQLSYGNSKNYTDAGKEQKIDNMTILPIAGVFVSPSVAVGLGVGYENSTTKLEGEQTGKSDLIIIKPLARKYWNITGGLFFFGQAAVPVLLSTGEEAKDTGKTKRTSASLELAPGLDLVVTKWLTIETSFTILNTGYTSSKPDGGKTSSTFGFNANPFRSIGDRTVGNLEVGVKFLF